MAFFSRPHSCADADKGIRIVYIRHTKIWMKRYGTGSGSDRVVLWNARSTGARSLPLPVPYRRALPSTPHLGVPLI